MNYTKGDVAINKVTQDRIVILEVAKKGMFDKENMYIVSNGKGDTYKLSELEITPLKDIKNPVLSNSTINTEDFKEEDCEPSRKVKQIITMINKLSDKEKEYILEVME